VSQARQAPTPVLPSFLAPAPPSPLQLTFHERAGNVRSRNHVRLRQRPGPTRLKLNAPCRDIYRPPAGHGWWKGIDSSRIEMESYLNENFGGVMPKHSSEEALGRWREVVGVVKNPKRRFRFTANLSKRSEAAQMKRSNQVRRLPCSVLSLPRGAAPLFLSAAFLVPRCIVPGIKPETKDRNLENPSSNPISPQYPNVLVGY
jgi:hypothetical protein